MRQRRTPRVGGDIRFGQSVGRNVQYDAEQVEFMNAADALRRRLGRMPSWPEVLREAKRLGYRRTMGS